jgi:HAD superfamily hydrolase (TIGR01509 family)
MRPVGDALPGGVDLPAGVLWDMDGTIIDTEPYWIQAEHELVAEHGGIWTAEHAHALVGADLIDAAEYIRTNGNVDLAPIDIVERLLARVVELLAQGAPWRPGARELLAEITAAGIPCALVTMSWRSFAGAVVDLLPPGTFDAVVTGDEVSHGKPHPEPYLLAAQMLGVSPSDCIAIEDSPTGAASAQAAGCVVVGVGNVVEVPPAPHRELLPTLAGVSLGDLTSISRRLHPLR